MSSQISPQPRSKPPPTWKAYRTTNQYESESDEEDAKLPDSRTHRIPSPLDSDDEDDDDSSPAQVRTSAAASLPHRRPTPESAHTQERSNVPTRFVPKALAVRVESGENSEVQHSPRIWTHEGFGGHRRMQESVFPWVNSSEQFSGSSVVAPLPADATESWDPPRSVSLPSHDSLESDTSSMEQLSSVSSCVHRGVRSEYVQCLIRRDRTSKIYPYYHLLLESSQQLLLSALKVRMSRTSNYHFFDMTRGVVEGSELTKKSGNYIGKLRARSSDHKNLVFVGRGSGYEELAALTFQRATLIDQYMHGAAPRRMQVVLPPVDNSSMKPIPNRPEEPGGKSLLDVLSEGDYGRYFVYQTKDPVLENGAFKLDFGGRVTVASVKNFQLVSEDDPDHVVCQFGKCGPDAFILDFQAPLNAAQAFAIALCQFNL